MIATRARIWVCGGLVFARVITAEIAIDRLDEAVGTARELLPATRESDGYRGFYVLTDRLAGRLALWAAQSSFPWRRVRG